MPSRYSARTLVSYEPAPLCSIQRLSADTLVDDLFIYLHVEDILCMRRVNKAFYILSHTPSIWKRLLIRLQRQGYLIPPLPPVPHNTFSGVDLDAEQLVIRAITIDENWRSPSPPKLYHKYKVLANPGSTVVDMKLAPGGKYLLVSTKDASNFHFYLTVFVLDHPDGPHALARIDTISKAYNLEAKFAHLWGCAGLWVAFVRRRLTPAPDEDKYGARLPVYEYGDCNIDPSDLSHEMDIDPPPGYTFENEVICYHLPLETLEMLSDPRLAAGCPQLIQKVLEAPEPFNDIGGFASPAALSNVSVFQYQSKPRLVAKLGNKHIICAAMLDPNRNELSTMIIAPVPNYERNEYIIEAIHPIPHQGSLLVARKIRVGRRYNVAALEIYDIPTVTGLETYDARHRYIISDRDVESIQIAGCETPITVPEETLSPNPISVYVRMRQSGVTHYSLFPSLVDLPINKLGLGPVRYRFTLAEDKHVLQSIHLTQPYECRVLPGVHRSVLCNLLNRDFHPSVASIRRHQSAFCFPSMDAHIYEPPVSEEEQVARRGRHGLPRKIYVTIDTPGLTDEINQNGGLSAITWEESIGRLCFAAGEDDSICVLDYGQTTHPDARLQRWKAELADREKRHELWAGMRSY